MRKAIIVAVAVLLVGSAAVVLAQPGADNDEGTHQEADNDEGTHQEADNDEGSHPVRSLSGNGLADLLAPLVEDGTITQDQSDAIVATMEQKRAQLETLWEDGVLTSDEIAQLPNADRILDPDGPYADALEDGQITRDEINEHHRHEGGHSFGNGAHFRSRSAGPSAEGGTAA